MSQPAGLLACYPDVFFLQVTEILSQDTLSLKILSILHLAHSNEEHSRFCNCNHNKCPLGLVTVVIRRYIFPVALPPTANHSLLSLEVSKSHNGAPQSVRLLWSNDELFAETSTWQHTTLIINIHVPRGGFEPTISAVERLQNYALDRAATGTGNRLVKLSEFIAWTKIHIIWIFPKIRSLNLI